MPANPPYVDDLGHGSQVPMPPGGIFDATLYAFIVTAQAEAMQSLADRFLSNPTLGAVTYHVIGDRVMLSFLRSPRLECLGQKLGFISDREWAVWIPLFAQSRDGSMPDRIVLWMAYIVIDSAEGMAIGREVWGFRKSVGTIALPSDPGDDGRCTATARIFDPLGSEGRWAPVAEAWKSGPLGELKSVWSDVKGVFEALVSIWRESGAMHVPRLGLIVDAAKLLESRKVPVVNLKQFRDATDPSRACYQAVIESVCTPTALHGGGPLDGQWSVRLGGYASYQLAQDIGVAPGAVLPVSFAFWLGMDFTADAGREVWRAG